MSKNGLQYDRICERRAEKVGEQIGGEKCETADNRNLVCVLDHVCPSYVKLILHLTSLSGLVGSWRPTVIGRSSVKLGTLIGKSAVRLRPRRYFFGFFLPFGFLVWA